MSFSEDQLNEATKNPIKPLPLPNMYTPSGIPIGDGGLYIVSHARPSDCPRATYAFQVGPDMAKAIASDPECPVCDGKLSVKRAPQD